MSSVGSEVDDGVGAEALMQLQEIAVWRDLVNGDDLSLERVNVYMNPFNVTMSRSGYGNSAEA